MRPDVTPGQVRAGLPDLLPEHPQPIDTLLDAVDRVVVPATVAWQHPGFYGYFPPNAALASLLGDLLSGGLGSQGMLWSTSPAGTEVEQALLDGLAGALGLDDGFTFAGGGVAQSPTRRHRRPGRAGRGAAPQLEPRRIGHQPVAGRGRRRPRARLRHRRDPLLHGQGRPGRGPGRPRAARRRARGRPCRPDRARGAAGADVAAVCGPCSCARPSAPPAPARSTRSARSPGSPASTARGCTSTPPGPGSRRSARSTGAARRRRARRLVLHRRPQVAAHGVRRLAAVGARRDGAARRPVDHPGVPARRRERVGRRGRLPRLAGLAGPAASGR